MPRIPTRVLTSAPQGSANPAQSTARSLAPAVSRQPGPTQPRQQFPDYGSNRVQAATRQATGPQKARYDGDNVPIPGVLFAAGVAQTFKHRLGRPYVGATIENIQPAVTGATPMLAYYIVPPADPRLAASQVTIVSLLSLIGDVIIW